MHCSKINMKIHVSVHLPLGFWWPLSDLVLDLLIHRLDSCNRLLLKLVVMDQEALRLAVRSLTYVKKLCLLN
jgi:hypothetical protein